MSPEEYGDKYSDHLPEQYKLYVEMTDRVSQRRERSNQFFITLLSGPAILAVFARFWLDGETIRVRFYPWFFWPVVCLEWLCQQPGSQPLGPTAI